jgi:phosphomannomutase
MKEKFASEKLNTVDGVRVDFEAKREWVHLRRSNTEPIIRVYSEAQSSERAEALGREVIALAESIIAE